MTTTSRIRVLISIPTFWQNYYFLPTIYFLLKDHCDSVPTLKDSVDWLPPISNRATVEELIAPYENERIDILGLSCYEWNWELQLKIATELKRKNPNLLVVAGGPQPDYKSPDFFEKHPQIDLIVPHEGEGPFASILERYQADKMDFFNISGTLSRKSPYTLPIVGKKHFLQSFDGSPFLNHEVEIQSLIRAHAPNQKKMAIWETNRGCPYGCTFCDWGSATMSQLRRFPEERLYKEIEFFSRNAFEVLFIADANFGIIERDVELARALAEQKKKTGFPAFVIYLTAKMNGKRNLEIAEIFHQAQMTSSVVLSLQHTDKEVLKIMRRTNMPDIKLREHLVDMEAKSIPFMPQMIIGSPGDTYAKWKQCLSDLLDMGMHEEIRSQNFSLLTNSPASEAEYMERWQIQTIQRYTICGTERRRKVERTTELTRSNYIVATSTYTQEDWVEMHMIDTIVKALHSTGMTRLLAVFMRHSAQIPYHEFYEMLKRNLFEKKGTYWFQLYERLKTHRFSFLSDANATEEIAIQDLEESEYLYTTEEWLTYYVAQNLDGFLEDVRGLCEKVVRPELIDPLAELLVYQRALFIDISYDRRGGRELLCNYDWPTYFSQALKVNVPALTLNRLSSSALFRAEDQSVGLNREHPLNWWERHPDQASLRNQHWFHTIVGPVHLRSKRALLSIT